MAEKHRILLVDDEPSIVKMVGKRLEIEGFEVVPDEHQIQSRVRGNFHLTRDSIALHLAEGQRAGSCMSGTDLCTALEGKPVLPDQVLDAPVDYPELILNTCTQCISFFGTKRRNADGLLFVGYLFWSGSWRRGERCLNYDWGSGYPSAVPVS